MNILLIGSGGREHTIALKLNESKKLSKLYIAPGNAGTAGCGENVAIKDTDINGLLAFALEKNIDLTIVGPEAPLVLGITDLFEEKGLKIIGPNKVAAQLEGSKEWAKSKMKAYGIPTAAYEIFTDFEHASKYVQEKNTYPIVIKADGLAAGKGVTVALNEAEAIQALKACLVDETFAEAGAQVVIEDFLNGQEASIFAFCDGKTIIPMLPAQDHKAIFDGDKGPNTGGMGAYCPAPIVTKELYTQIYEKVFIKLLDGFKKDNIHYQGIVYAGLMIDGDDFSIVEFNARFGDPETQVVLPQLDSDLLEIFAAMANQTLDKIHIRWNYKHSVCIVIASEGYPGSYEKGKVITGLDKTKDSTWIIHAGTKTNDQKEIITNGGRVLGVISQTHQLEDSINAAYETASSIHFEGAYYRKDIGAKAFTKS